VRRHCRQRFENLLRGERGGRCDRVLAKDGRLVVLEGDLSTVRDGKP